MLTPGMVVLVYGNQKVVSFGGRLTSRERQGGGDWERLVYCVWLIVCGSLSGPIIKH